MHYIIDFLYKIYIAKNVTILLKNYPLMHVDTNVQNNYLFVKQSLTINCNYSIFSDVMKLAL